MNITADCVIKLLQRENASTNPRDHDNFSCMLHFLFDDYKFFVLAITGYWSSSLIQYQVINFIRLGISAARRLPICSRPVSKLLPG